MHITWPSVSLWVAYGIKERQYLASITYSIRVCTYAIMHILRYVCACENPWSQMASEKSLNDIYFGNARVSYKISIKSWHEEFRALSGDSETSCGYPFRRGYLVAYDIGDVYIWGRYKEQFSGSSNKLINKIELRKLGQFCYTVP